MLFVAVSVLCLFLTLPLVGLWSIVVAYPGHTYLYFITSGLEVRKLEYSLRLKIKRNDWLLVDTCPHAANHCSSF